jgi:glycosyltransferase family protein
MLILPRRNIMLIIKRIYTRLFIIPIRHLRYIYYEFIHRVTRNLYPKIKILSDEDTINEIIENKKSVSRFGDGEISWILGTQEGSFQLGSAELAKKLSVVLSSTNETLLVCLPSTFNTLSGIDINAKHFWSRIMHHQRFHILYYINNNVFGNSLFTRPYMIYSNKNNAKEKFENIKRIWNERNVVIIEGEFTYFGIENDLLSNSKSVRRIICPHKNAFEVYNRIFNEAKKLEESTMILLALGPTATILAYDLAMLGYQAIDIGHVDIEYEWFLRRARKKIAVEGKYVNEISNKIDTKCLLQKEESYVNSIITIIKND